jgi:hypothetical protein
VTIALVPASFDQREFDHSRDCEVVIVRAVDQATLVLPREGNVVSPIEDLRDERFDSLAPIETHPSYGPE